MWKRALSTGDDRGQILILTALSMTVLLAVAALSLDVSYMYDKRNRLHAAADAAAKSAAIEVFRHPFPPPSTLAPALQTFANQQVTAHGFNLGAGTNVIVRWPPEAPTHPDFRTLKYVEVLVSETTGTFFGGVLGFASMTPGARAVAGPSPGPNCIVTLGSPPESLDLGVFTNLAMPACSLAAGGDMSMLTPSSIVSLGTAVTGGCAGPGCSGVANMTTGAPPPTDPLAGLSMPPFPGGCAPAPGPVGGIMTVPGNACYSTITVPDNTTVNFGSGVIYLMGRFSTGNAPTINGTGVVFFLQGEVDPGPCDAGALAGCFDIGTSANVNLSAPTSGPYTGILFFQREANHLRAEFAGSDPTYDLSGVMYMPGAHVQFVNSLNNPTNDCTLLIAKSLEINSGDASFSNTCSAYGGSPILTVSIAE